MERGLGGEDCGHSVGAVHRCLDFSDTRAPLDKSGQGESRSNRELEKKAPVLFLGRWYMSKGSRVEKQAVRRQTMSSAFVSKCQRIVLKTSRADENGAHTCVQCSLIRPQSSLTGPQSSLTRPQWFLTRAKCSLTEAKSSVTGVKCSFAEGKCSLTDRECSANRGKCSRAAWENTLTGNQATRIRD